jgi:hypothetical protein
MAIKWDARMVCEEPGCGNSYPVDIVLAEGALKAKPRIPHGWSRDGRKCREHTPPPERPLRLVG